MNVLLIITGVIFLICIIVGFARGFIKITASLAATIVIIMLVSSFTPKVSEGIREITPLESMVGKKCTEALVRGMEKNASGISEEELKNMLEDAKVSREKQIELIEKADLPEVFRGLLLENNNSEVYQVLGADTFGEYVGRYLTKIISDIAAFLITLFVVTVVVRSIVHALGWIGKLPVIGGINRLAGGLLGVVTGLVIVWVMFIVIILLYDTDMAKMCFENINDSQLLTFLYKNNVLMHVIMGTGGF